MSLTQFLPNVVKELLKHVPSLVFEVTDWNSVRRDAPLMTTRLFSKAGVSSLKKFQSAQLSPFISFSDQKSAGGMKDPQGFGDALLRYYFAQLYCSEGIFLDIRDENFKWAEGLLHYNPNGFWYHFTPVFRLGLLDLYEGFYLEDDAKFQRGLLSTRLIQENWSLEDQNHMKQLFRNHFGASLDEPMSFNLVDFQKTFLKIFEFLMEKKVVLSSEFMLFGIYLVTLYLGLEKLGQKHAVKKLYLDVHTRLKGSRE